MSHKYKLTYEWHAHPTGLTAEEVLRLRKGACDEALLASVIRQDDEYSCQFVSKSGDTDKEISDTEIFQIWIALTQKLASSSTLEDGPKKFCEAVFNSMIDAVKDSFT